MAVAPVVPPVMVSVAANVPEGIVIATTVAEFTFVIKAVAALVPPVMASPS